MSIDLSVCTEKILEFHSSVHATEAIDVELKFNKCVYDVIAENDVLVFLISTWRSPDNAHVRALGNTPLKHEMFFEIVSNPLREIMQNGEKTIVGIDVLHEKLQRHISKIVKAIPREFQCIPFKPEDPKLPKILCCLLSPEDKCECMKHVHAFAVDYMLRIVNFLHRYCGNTLSLAFLHDEQVRLYQRSRNLLDLAESLFQNLGDVSGVLSVVMHEAQKLVKAERCSLFLVDKKQGTLNAKIFDGAGGKDVKITIDQGIAGQVVLSGRVMNVHDTYKDPAFYRRLDEDSGFKTRNMLCVPILSQGEVIAVAQLCNKIDFPHFTKFDEEIAGPFASYCGICIQHTMLYEKMVIAKARQKLTNELMMFHMKQKVHLSEKIELIKCESDHRFLYRYDTFACSPILIKENHTVCIVLEIFDELGLMEEFDIPRDIMARCIICMKAGYRDPPYHNWMHAFSVLHFGYLMIRYFHLIEEGYMSKLEAMAFLVACVGHDIDHRGTTNAFQSRTGTELASLYSSQGSVMERHHFQQTMCVLHLEDCNIFENIDKEQYSHCVEIINHVILATDLANHFKNHKAQEQAFNAFVKDNPRHRDLLFSAMVTCADFGMQTKDFHSIRLTVKSLYAEFFRQGDLEAAFGVAPSSMMDRRNACIPQQQVEFLENLVIPVFELLRPLFPAPAARLLDALREVQRCWRQAAPVFARRLQAGQEALRILDDRDFEAEVLDLVARQADAGGESP